MFEKYRSINSPCVYVKCVFLISVVWSSISTTCSSKVVQTFYTSCFKTSVYVFPTLPYPNNPCMVYLYLHENRKNQTIHGSVYLPYFVPWIRNGITTTCSNLQRVFLCKETMTWRSFWRCWSGQWIPTLGHMMASQHYTSQLLAVPKTVYRCCWKQRQNLQQLKLGWNRKGLVFKCVVDFFRWKNVCIYIYVVYICDIFYLHICIPICLGLKDRKHSFTPSYQGSTCWGHLPWFGTARNGTNPVSCQECASFFFMSNYINKLGGGFKYFFHPYLGKWSNLTYIFQMGRNHQLDKQNTTLKFY